MWKQIEAWYRANGYSNVADSMDMVKAQWNGNEEWLLKALQGYSRGVPFKSWTMALIVY